jgi:MoaA/NifB/PqqE/SkfB family radical SAM enzyme
VLTRIEGSLRLRRALRRAGHGLPARSAAARPLGVKLELTHRCNLRCAFCYTDSPRHTLARTPDLDDDAWRRIVAEAIELGVIEAVVIGGEPLLRAPLALELMERLTAAGVGTTMTTNGWFLDDALADRLAPLAGLTVNVSIDGATPSVHDAARGVPGSWRRAVEAVHLLLERSVRAQVIHVVTPDNRDGMGDFLEQMWVLGVEAVLLVPVAQVGAAARSPRWRVGARGLQVAARESRRRHPGMEVVPEPLLGGSLADQGRRAPASLLVRPSGVVQVDSLHPFAFGNAATDGVGECWRRIAAGWDDPAIDRWARGIGNLAEISASPLVPYRDDPVEAADWEPDTGATATPAPALPAAATARPGAGPDDGLVRALALGRRHRVAAVRTAQDGMGGRYVRVTGTGRVNRLNHTAAAVMDAVAVGIVADAAAALRARHPGVAPGTAERDALAAVRVLRRRGILAPLGRNGR